MLGRSKQILNEIETVIVGHGISKAFFAFCSLPLFRTTLEEQPLPKMVQK